MVNIAVMVMAENLNKKLSVVGPGSVTPPDDGTVASMNNSNNNADRKPSSETQQVVDNRLSAAGPNTSLFYSVQAKFVMETASFTLYWSSTFLVLSVYICIKHKVIYTYTVDHKKIVRLYNRL